MSLSSSVFSVLLLTSDPEIQAKYKHVFKDASITIVKDLATMPKDVARRTFDAVIVESKPGSSPTATALLGSIDLSNCLVITGSRTALKRASKFMQVMRKHKTQGVNGVRALPLEDYLEGKMGDFVKGMRNGSARNLHPMLITAMERPLITLALQETKGNQIQAAELVGLNRNTLRKKIHDLHIPVKRGRAVQNRSA
jgi:two-component system nitrogen regulation response regulator GlnG